MEIFNYIDADGDSIQIVHDPLASWIDSSDEDLWICSKNSEGGERVVVRVRLSDLRGAIINFKEG